MGRNTRRLLIAALVVFGAGVAGAQTTPTTTTTPNSSTLSATAPAVEQIVAIAQTVEPGAAGVTAFTVPAGRQLVITDVVITNPSTTPICGAAISPRGATTSPPTTSTLNSTTSTMRPITPLTTPSTAGSTVTTPTATTTTSTATIESGTGTLCIPAQTSLTLSLATGLEFAGGQSVILGNHLPTTTTTTPTGPLFYHLRGFLVGSSV